jgi:predicted O-methyltransferase YrrM
MSTASPERVTSAFWLNVLTAGAAAARHARVQRIMLQAEARRVRADYDTGSITEQEAVSLCALAEYLKARSVIEVGTFIGTSTEALAAARTVEKVYTCDVSNDCLPQTAAIKTFPRLRSTDMLRWLVAHLPQQADLCFFDGVLSAEDVALLARVTHPRTVYALHDYNYGPKIRRKGGAVYLETVPRKGIGNAALLQPRLSKHVIVEPAEGTTLALLVPEALL